LVPSCHTPSADDAELDPDEQPVATLSKATAHAAAHTDFRIATPTDDVQPRVSWPSRVNVTGAPDQVNHPQTRPTPLPATGIGTQDYAEVAWNRLSVCLATLRPASVLPESVRR
jgi:hypothetical protein